MSFFSRKKEGSAPAVAAPSPAAAAPVEQKGPISWEDLVGTDHASPPAVTVRPDVAAANPLPDSAIDTLKKAGKGMRDALFRDGNDSDESAE